MKRLSHIPLAITFVLLSLICMVRCKREHAFPEKITIPTKDFAIVSDVKESAVVYRILFYMEFSGCPSCRIADFQEIEDKYSDFYKSKKVDFIYIIETDDRHKYTVYSMFCNARLKGHIYVDTSKKFISFNSGFSKYYCTNHVLILDSLDNVKKVIGYFQMKNADVCNLYE